MRRAERGGDVGAGAEAGIDQPVGAQPFECVGISGASGRLDERLAIPDQAEPAQILFDGGDELGPAARRVEILDPQQEAPARLAGRRMAEDGALGVTEMQLPGRRRREASRQHILRT